MKSIVVGGGCFWCIEAVFQQVKGVESVVSGYAGGDLANPNYYNHGNHAEVVQLSYDESVITLEELLNIFFSVHDPTTLQQPGTADVGESYRSIILTSENELDAALKAKDIAQANWDNPIITEIKPLDTFFPAEDYHQNYYQNNPEAGYCRVIINPKLAKFTKNFKNYVKS